MDKIYKIPKYNKELYLGGTLMKDLKNFVKPILFLTIGLLLISLVKNIDFMSMMTKIQNNMQQGLTVVKITDEKSEIKDDNLNIKFKVPSIHYNDKEVEKSINSYIKKNIKEYINVQRQINKMNKYSEKYVVNITYNVVFEDENLINIVIEKNTTWGKKDYKLEKDSYVFNLNTGKRVYLDEFLKGNDDYSAVITKTIQKNMDNKHPLYNNLNIDKNTNYYIQDKYINIYFNPYKQSEDDTQHQWQHFRHSPNHKMTACSGQRCKGHNKYAGSHCRLKFVTKNTCQKQKHHHTATGTNETADKAHHNTTYNGLE